MNFTNGKFYIVDAKSGENLGSVVQQPYDEDEINTEKGYDSLVLSLIKAGGEIRELRELLSRAYEQILLLGYDSMFTNEEIEKLMNDIREYYRGVNYGT